MAAGDEPAARLGAGKATLSSTPSVLGKGCTSLKMQKMAGLLVGVVLGAEMWEGSWVRGVPRGSAVAGGAWQGRLSTE